MKKYSYVIIDDDDMDRLMVSFYLKIYPFLEQKATFSTSSDGIHYLQNHEVDIVFLDIEMPGINGIELQRRILNSACSIFITSHPEFALEGFELDAFDYILKPLDSDRFNKCIGRLKEYLDLKYKAELFEEGFKEETFLVKKGREHIGISPNEITYLEALKDYTKFVSYENKTTTIHGNLGNILRDERFRHFIRIHRSYAIQRKYIHTVKTNEILLTTGAVLPIGKYYRDFVSEALI
ncbi:MAG TPA: DNA-binding response regulator [Dysgonomonas sp.]|nr:DNA-binding response regulator [Dysgonomonas sp.]